MKSVLRYKVMKLKIQGDENIKPMGYVDVGLKRPGELIVT